MRFLFHTALPSLLLAASSLAQTPIYRQWLRHENGVGHSDDYAFYTAIDSQGRACSTGMVTAPDGGLQVLTVLYDANGAKLWERTYVGSGGGGDYGNTVAFTPDGGVVVAADSVGATTDYDIVLLRYDSDGNLLWESRYDGPGHGFDALVNAKTLAVDTNGEIMVAGYSVGVGTAEDMAILRYSPSGNLLWSDRINGSANYVDTAYALSIDANHDIFIGGETTDAVTGRDILILKYDATGNRLWQHQYAGPGTAFDFVWAGELDPSGNFVICGLTGNPGQGDDAIVQKYDTNGNLLWTNTFNGAHNGNDGAFSMAVSAQGDVGITGYVRKDYEDLGFTQLYGAGGSLLWTREFRVSTVGYLGFNDGVDCRFNANGELYVVGRGWNGPEHGIDAYLLRYSPTGNISFLDIYDAPVHGDDWGFQLALDAQDHPYMTGYTQRGAMHLDTLLIKYGPKAAIEPDDGAHPEPGDDGRGRERLAPRHSPAASPLPYRPRSRLPLPLPMRPRQ